jgi:hypothetical protein
MVACYGLQLISPIIAAFNYQPLKKQLRRTEGIWQPREINFIELFNGIPLRETNFEKYCA